MKRSHRVPLLVIGTLVALTGCEKTEDLKQNYYASREDCQKDWGPDEKDCTPSRSTGSSHGGGYFGPRYYWDRGIGHPVAVSPSGETRVLSNSYLSRGVPSAGGSSFHAGSFSHSGSSGRGGFGSSSRSFSGGG